MSTKRLRQLFLVAGLYDGLLGLGFLVAHDWIFAFFQMTPANHPAYIEFPALLLIIFGAMFLHIASDPRRHRNLIPYGIALKASYATLAFWYHTTSEIPSMWLPWAWMDLGFLFAFAYAWWSISKERSAT